MAYSRWASIEEIISKTTQISYDSNIKKSGIEIMYDDNHLYIDDKGAHNLIIGATGSGKTQATMLPQMRLAIKAEESFVVNDINGEVYNILSGELVKQGYNLYVINLVDTTKGNNYNPLSAPYKLYREGKRDNALEMIENIGYYLLSTNNENEDPFWEKSAINLFTGLVLYLFENAKDKEININSVAKLLEYDSMLKEHINNLDKSSSLYIYLSSVLNAPNETKGSIYAVFRQRIMLYTSREGISRILSSNNINLENIQKEKTALFIINDNKTSTKDLVSLIIDQCNYVESLNKAERRLNILIDDFENIKAFKNFVNTLNLARGNNVRYSIYIKSLLELDNVYGKRNTELLKMSFGNIIYLLANDIETLQQISNLCGRLDENTKLISEEELKTMDYFEAIIIAPRMYPIRTKLLPDYQIDWKFEKNPVPQPNLENTNVELYKIKED